MDIYVGNLAYKTTDDSLRSLFAQYGEVTSARVVTDRISGRSKGFGFVEMPDEVAAQAAIDAINGNDFEGRPLRVNKSQPKPREERPRGGFRRREGGNRDRGGFNREGGNRDRGGFRAPKRDDGDRW